MWKLRNIYLYLVCFVTLMMMVFGTVNIIGSITDIIFPVDYSYHIPKMDTSDSTEPTEKQLEEARQREQQNRDMENKKRLIKAVSFVLVALPVFVYHWRKIENEKNHGMPA